MNEHISAGSVEGNMRQEHVAHASVKIHARPEKVWDALTDPEQVRRYMEGAQVTSNWTAGSPITWQGEFRGKRFEDRGRILRAERCRVLEYTHFSPTPGVPDEPENHHTVRIELDGRGGETDVKLTQEGNPTEEARQHSEENWRHMLDGLRDVVEEDEPDMRTGGDARRMEGGRDRGPGGPDAWSGPERAQADPNQMRGQQRNRDRDGNRQPGRDPDQDRY